MNPDAEEEICNFLKEVDGNETPVDWAAVRGHLAMVKYLYEKLGMKCTDWDLALAAWDGHTDVVKYLHGTMKLKCTKDALEFAARRGCLELVRYMIEVAEVEFTEYAMEYAESRRHFEVMAYLFERGFTLKTTYAELPERVHELLRKSAKEAFRRAVRKARYVSVFNRLLVRVRFRPGGDGAEKAKRHFEQLATHEEKNKKRARISY